jgi:methyl-accepting chemotaxis protein
MTHVRHNIDRVPAEINASRERYERDQALQAIDSAALLAELEKTYAMADEHAVHKGNKSAPAPQPADEITFF